VGTAQATVVCVLLASLRIASAWAQAPVAPSPPADAGFLERESFGFELSPVVFNGFRSRIDRPLPPRYSFWPALGLRLHRLRWSSGYWTPAQLGFGWGMGGESGLLAQLQTELGYVHRGRGTLEVGLGLGVGLFQVEASPSSCDGACTLGGHGWLVSPVVRYLFLDRTDRLSLGLFARVVWPATENGFGIQGHRLGRATGFLAGLDLGLGYFNPPPTATAAPVPLPTREWLGLELSVLSFNDGTAWGDPQRRDPPGFSLGAGLDLRLFRFRHRFGYWTPLAVGLFWGRLGANTNLLQARTEAGLVFQRRSAALEFGLGLAYGGAGVVYAKDASGGRTIGGRGLLVSPVVRLIVARGPHRSWGGFCRLVVPNNEEGFGGAGYGALDLYLCGLDLGFGRI
jgi:hypothetical protein